MVRSNSIQPDPTKKKQPWQGALSKKKVGGSEGSPLQEVDYTYNIRGWLTSVNQPQNLGKDLFGFELKYQNPVSNGKDTPKYNGNISQMDWKTRSNNEELRRYTYQYDDLNRLTKSFYSKPLAVQPNTGSYDEYLSYDVNGNIKTLSRFGDMDKPQAVKIDELSYTYIGNQLVKVSDNSQNPSGYPIGGGVIPYDENGNMMNHNDKGISYIGYNHLNLPSAVFWNGKQTFYLYRADGVKVKKDFPGKVTDYLDGFQYENGALQFVPTAEGYYDFVKQRYVYNYTDHLGNVRLSYAKNNNSALEILEENNYYAFGLKHKGYGGVNLGNPNYHYKYNGKELQENSMYDYGARLYMPDIGRWNTIDPLAEKTHDPYGYVWNNPMKFIDPDGRAPMDDHFNAFGKFLHTDNKATNNIVVHIGKVEYNLSQLDYSNRGTLKAVSKILAYYAGEKGMKGYTGVGTFERGSAHTNRNGNIFFNIKTIKTGIYDNVYNVKSSLNHELGHKEEDYEKDYSFKKHANIYLLEASHPDFAKTTEEYKVSQSISFGQRVLNANFKEDRKGYEILQNMGNLYNTQNTGGIRLRFNVLGRGGSVTPYIGKKQYKTQEYENIENARN